MTITDINSEARALCSATTTSYTAPDLLRRVNSAYEEVVALILGADGRWQFDDTNFTDFPIATTTMVESQNDYSFDVTHLEIERVEVLDSSSLWHTVNPIDISQVGVAIPEYQKNDGLPTQYDKNGSSIVLYPAPTASSVTLASGLKVYFKRTADLFTAGQVTTGTKVPGFASPYHVILAYMAAIPYCEVYKKDRVSALMTKVDTLKRDLIKHYSRREQDRRKILSPSGIKHR